MDEYVEEELKRANEALTDAEILLENGSERAVINRLYYACFHTAQAVLYARGFDPDTHGGVLTLFGWEVVRAGDATSDDGRFFNEIQSYRLAADYEHGSMTADVEDLFERTAKFVADMEALAESGQ